MHRHSSSRAIALLSLTVALLLGACGDDSVRPDTVPAEVRILAVDTLRSIGATAALTATARNASQQPIAGTAISGWESSDPYIITVDAGSGIATAVANGQATVTARAGTVRGSVTVVVRQRIDPTKSTIGVVRPLLFVDDTVRVTLDVRDALGTPIKLYGATVVLSSSGGISTLTPGRTVDQQNGTYTADFVGVGVGTARAIGATIDGTPLTIASPPTLRVVGFTRIATQSYGFPVTCGIITTGELYCWGEPNSLSRGTGLAPAGPAPTLVAGDHRWTDVDVRALGGCGIADTAKLFCWGLASEGALGNGETEGSYPFPVALLPESSFVSVDVGLAIGTCAITAGHTAMCWSLGTFGRLGNGAETIAAAPVPVNGGHKFAGIGTSFSGSCGVTDAGEALCWGFYNTLGTGGGPYPDTCVSSVPCARNPVPVSGGVTFKPIIFHGGNEVCAIATNDKTYCWGQWGIQVPTELLGAPVFTAIATGDSDNCGIAQSGAAYCWGTNRNGRFGMPPNSNEAHRVPELVPGGHRFTQLSMGQNHMCGVAIDGNAWCWGSNSVGELGDRTMTRSAVPVRVKLFAP